MCSQRLNTQSAVPNHFCDLQLQTRGGMHASAVRIFFPLNSPAVRELDGLLIEPYDR
jgi:hypothetical protein